MLADAAGRHQSGDPGDGASGCQHGFSQNRALARGFNLCVFASLLPQFAPFRERVGLPDEALPSLLD